MVKRRGYKCPWCFQTLNSIQAFRFHTRTKHPHESRHEDTDPLPNKLLSNRSEIDSSSGVFEFDGILAADEFATCVEIAPDSDDDSYYSDFALEYELGGGGVYSSSSSDNDDDDDDNDDDDDADDDEDDWSDITFQPSQADDNDDNDDVMDYVDADADDDDDDDDATPTGFHYFTPNHVPDDQIPLSENTFSHNADFTPSSSFVAQLWLMDLFNRSKGSLKMYDEMIEIFNTYISSTDFNVYSKLSSHSSFLEKIETAFSTNEMKPTYGAVRLHNDTYATVPVFDVKTMILSILHDPKLMNADNFAKGYDVFTGDVDRKCRDNKLYGEIHTGDAWPCAKERFCGKNGKYMPFGMVIFADKSHTDLHGSLSMTPITFTATFFNSSVRNNPSCWRPIAYLPNLGHGKSGSGKSRDKVQDEHNCLAYALKSLVELSDAGSIRTIVMGKEVIIKPFIHYFIGDTEGHNKWLGHYTGSKPGMARPYRDCHCTFEQLSSKYPECVYTTAAEFRQAMRTIARDKKLGTQQLKSLSRHYVNNAMYQTRLPLSNEINGANKMCPPETLHVMDAGLTIYMQESLQNRTSAGQSREELNQQHIRMFNSIRRNSERDLPRGATRNGLTDSTRCQSSERKGNLFLLLCIASTVSGQQILQHELNYSSRQWKQWIELLTLYLALGEWIHDARPKKEVRESRTALAVGYSWVQHSKNACAGKNARLHV
jgi:hypothetical protein